MLQTFRKIERCGVLACDLGSGLEGTPILMVYANLLRVSKKTNPHLAGVKALLAS